MAATSRNPGAAATRPSRGTCSSASLITVMRTLSVSSGMRLISSTYNSEPSRRAATSGPSSKISAAYPSASTRAGSKWPTRRAGVSSALPSTNSNPMPSSSATARSSVDLPVPGGPSRRMCRPAARAATTSSSSRRRPTTRRPSRSSSGSVVDDDAADVGAIPHVLVADVDVVERVAAGDELVEPEVALAVEVEELRDVGPWVERAEDRALDLLLPHGQLEEVDAGLVLRDGRDRGDDHRPDLPREVVRAGHELAVEDAGGHDHPVGHLAPRHLHDGREGLVHRRERMGGAELHRLLALELDR